MGHGNVAWLDPHPSRQGEALAARSKPHPAPWASALSLPPCRGGRERAEAQKRKFENRLTNYDLPLAFCAVRCQVSPRAVAPPALPPPSLGVSSLDLGRWASSGLFLLSPRLPSGEQVDRARRQVLQAAHSRCRQLGVEFCATRCTCCGAATLVAVALYGRFLPRLGHWFILVTLFLFGDLPLPLFYAPPDKQGQIRIRRRACLLPPLAGTTCKVPATCSCPGRMRESLGDTRFDKIPIRRRTCKDAVPAEQSR